MNRFPARPGSRASRPLHRAASVLSAVALAALLLLAPRLARATGDPDLAFWTLETAHFRVHHPQGLEPIAARIASLAETIYGRVEHALGYAPQGRTEIVITDDSEIANGSAGTLPYNSIHLLVSGPEDMSTLGDYDDWYLDLLTHEFTHIAHIDNTSGIPAILNAIVGKSFSPNQVQPRWIIEGLAVVSESNHTSGGRMRSTMFDMYLRADVLEDNIAGLDQISNSPFRWPQGTLWYLYGSRFLGWIIDVYGPNTMRAVSADYGASIIPWGINRAIRRVTGKTYVELYEGWKDHLRRLYREQMAAVEARGLREGTRLTHHGRTVYYPRFVPPVARRAAADEIVYFRDDGRDRPGIYRVSLAAPAPRAHRREALVARTNAASRPAFTPAGDMIFTALMPWRNHYYRDDLVFLPRGEEAPDGDEPSRHRLTRGLRSSAPDVSPTGDLVAFSLNSKGTRYLEIARLARDGTLSERRDLVPSARFEQAYSPSFSPDGKRLAYSVWTAGGYRDIRVVDVATGGFHQVTRDRATDMSPVWSPDGETLYFTSDRTGIHNVYAYALSAGTLRQVTNVRLGAFHPAISPDGKTLVYVGYTSRGHDLFVMPLNPARFLPAPPPPTDRPDPPTEPSAVRLERSPYNPFPTLAPRAITLDYAPGSYGSNALTVSVTGSDIVGRHSVFGELTVQPDAPAPTFLFGYTYGRLPIDLGVRAYYAMSPRGGYRISGRNVTYDERSIGIVSGVSYPIRGEFSRQSLSASFSSVAFKGQLPIGDKLDPYAPRTVLPPQGTLNLAHIGYGFSNAEGSVEAAGAPRGLSLNAGLDYAGPETGSSYTTYAFSTALSAYVAMPWSGDHTLAFRVAGAVSGGNFPRGAAYAVGGYDLENLTLVDTLLTGVTNSSFTLRGYAPGVMAGRSYFSQTFEYRVPVLQPDRGLSTLPLYLRRIDASLFLDHGGAFNRFEMDDLALFTQGSLLYSPQLHTSIGGEVWLSLTAGYVLSSQLRFGYAYGLSPLAIPGGQIYFVATNSF
ncbi:BamA/TamA family outer membrane protein [Sorangium sp. So ce1078]|uniref:BamA/TamA family outer membrane protein n=1 Tax=Sorangium sp. So ce1078 TaxID=3133329 RepID=UPI003F625FB3